MFVCLIDCLFACVVCLCVCVVVCLFVPLFVYLVGWLFVSVCACLFLGTWGTCLCRSGTLRGLVASFWHFG